MDLYPIVVESVGTDSGIVTNCDNFYLDMNGIIHSCTHSNDDKLVTLKEQEMFLRIFSYTDRYLHMNLLACIRTYIHSPTYIDIYIKLSISIYLSTY